MISSQNKNKAFTLAETLITLAVIGVVAAFTIPTLHSKFKEQATVAKARKLYATLDMAYNAAVLSKGSAEYWGTKPWSEEAAHRVFEILFEPYFKIRKNCGTSNEGNCIINENYLTFYGNKHYIYAERDGYYKIVLNDGSQVWFRGGDPEELQEFIGIYYDVNGANPPNQVGVDLFLFIGRNNRVVPEGIDTFDSACKKKSGFNCTAWVVHKGNMEYLRCDDLKWNGKQKCSK